MSLVNIRRRMKRNLCQSKVIITFPSLIPSRSFQPHHRLLRKTLKMMISRASLKNQGSYPKLKRGWALLRWAREICKAIIAPLRNRRLRKMGQLGRKLRVKLSLKVRMRFMGMIQGVLVALNSLERAASSRMETQTSPKKKVAHSPNENPSKCRHQEKRLRAIPSNFQRPRTTRMLPMLTKSSKTWCPY